MKRLSIRASVTAWFVGVTTLLLAAFSAALYLGISASLHHGLDAELRARAEAFASRSEWEEDVGGVEFDLPPERAAELARAGPGRGYEVRTWPQRELLHASGEPVPGPAAAEAAAGATFATHGEIRTCTLLATIPVVPASGGEPRKRSFSVLVRVTDSLVPLREQLASIRWIVLLVAAGTVVIVLAFGLFLSRRFVRPLQRLGDAAAAVRAGRQERMPHRGTGDEIDQLAATLDASFGALRGALERQARFTADAAHELRNPISVIHSAAEVARRRERTPQEYDAFLDDIQHTAHRMGSAVEALLLLARMDSGTARAAFDDVDLAALAAESAAAQRQQPSRIQVSNGHPVTVRGDRDLLRVMLDNLLSNALRYSGADAPVQVSVAHGDGGVWVRVRDHGPGVPDEHADRLFERFYRVEDAHPNRDGAGLGLSIVAAVARLHGARCAVANAEPGAEFSVRFTAPGGTDDGAR